MQALRKWQCDYMNYLNYQRWTQMTLPYTMSMMQMQQFYLQQQVHYSATIDGFVCKYICFSWWHIRLNVAQNEKVQSTNKTDRFSFIKKIQQQNEGSNQQRARGVRGFHVFNPFALAAGRPRPQPRNGGIPQARPYVQPAQPNAGIDGALPLVEYHAFRFIQQFLLY